LAVARRHLSGFRYRRLSGLKHVADSFWAAAYGRVLAKGNYPVVPPFSLRDIDGASWSLDESLDKPTILIFTSPHCGPCKSVYPIIRELRDSSEASSTNLVLLSRGATKTNRTLVEEHGLEGVVVLGSRRHIEKKLNIAGTPWALLVGPGARLFYEGVADEAVLKTLTETATHPLMTSAAAR
jgi:thiol-disulfide isomerase/thioredoxin